MRWYFEVRFGPVYGTPGCVVFSGRDRYFDLIRTNENAIARLQRVRPAPRQPALRHIDDAGAVPAGIFDAKLSVIEADSSMVARDIAVRQHPFAAGIPTDDPAGRSKYLEASGPKRRRVRPDDFKSENHGPISAPESTPVGTPHPNVT